MSISAEKNDPVKIGISIGDFNGIGPEVIIKSLANYTILQLFTPIIYGSAKVISFYKKILGTNEFNYNVVKSADVVIPGKINLIACWEEDAKIDPGQPTDLSGKYALKALEAAAFDLARKKIDALVTAPINKHMTQQEGFNFPGHTEYLAEKFHVAEYLMLMVAEDLKVAVVTGHIPLDNVAASLTQENILKKINTLNQSLVQDFGLRKPRIAVLGLNPHAGENGLLGNEETETIAPAIRQAFANGLMVYGPYPADGFFGSGTYKKFDAVLAMYHDQGLIPFKALSFSSGVNFTAGLPVVRTSPDHGTAYELAGKNEASENSFREALYLSCDIARKRKEYTEITTNPLKFTKLGRDH